MGQMPQPGTVFERKYLIEERIGEGGFAAVFRGKDINSQRLVAIKVLEQGEEHWQMGDKLAARFEREAQLLAQLNNEHTVRLLEYSKSEQGALYLVFEYVDGVDLADWLAQHGPLKPARVVSILQQVCAALGEAHRLGVLHRDIKPANIMVYRHMNVRDLVKLLDFGIAKSMGDSSERGGPGPLTTAGIVLGTPRYMSPEQISGSKLSTASDIYSLGLVAFELLTGRPCASGDSRTTIVREQLSPAEFSWPRTPKIPRTLKRIIGKMVKKDRRARYQTCEEILVDLEQWSPVEDWPTTRHWAMLGGGAAAVAIVAVVMMGGSEKQSAEPTPEPPPAPASVTRPAPKVAPVAPLEKPRPPVLKAPPEPSPKEAAQKVEADEEAKPAARTPRKQPADDKIPPLKLRSAAEAKTVATAAFTSGDFRRVIAACKPFANRSSFCARMLAEAYSGRGDVDRACYWFEVVHEVKHGLPCDERAADPE